MENLYQNILFLFKCFQLYNLEEYYTTHYNLFFITKYIQYIIIL
jgi:hypothetical protein